VAQPVADQSVLIRQLQTVAPLQGNGSPENVVAAPVGTLYLRRDGGTGTTLYVKETGVGASGWTAK
jgi:hypothetical protein